MGKLFGIVAVMVFALALLTGVRAETEGLCDDTDGLDIWTAGYATDEQGENADACDGESENLKEFICDGDKARVDNVDCAEFNAVCVSGEGADVCACPRGTEWDAADERCVGEGAPEIPEFGVIAGASALVSALGISLVRRN